MEIRLRDFPFPYKAMLAISSDLDETNSFCSYIDTIDFLNSDNNTKHGKGVDLEFANSLYFYMDDGRFCYINSSDEEKITIQTYIRAGLIDTIHSYGDTAVKREQVECVVEELRRENCSFKVWIDHAQAKSNFGEDIMEGEGAIPDSQIYHADLTFSLGIKYIWIGRVTSSISQGINRSYAGIINSKYWLASFKTILKDLIKSILASAGNEKYSMHNGNKLTRKNILSDGSKTIEFIRTNPHYGGVSCGENGEGIAEILVPEVLEQMVKSRGYSILYTHLGKVDSKDGIFSGKTVAAFKLLQHYKKQGWIHVATVSRLLEYHTLLANIKYSVCEINGGIEIVIDPDSCINTPLDGLTFYTALTQKTSIFLGLNKIDNVVINPEDETGLASISISWNKLSLPLKG